MEAQGNKLLRGLLPSETSLKQLIVGLLRIKRQLKWRLDLQLMAMLYWWVWFLPFINLKTITDSRKILTLPSCLLVDPFVCTASRLIHVYKNANCLQQLIDENVDEINDNKQSQRRLFFFFFGTEKIEETTY